MDSRQATFDWNDYTEKQPPIGEPVLMWFRATEKRNAWVATDRTENRVLRKPDFWAKINPPE